ncbi:SPW repeat domain-containing protein [Pontibacter vulgaris]|uniref:SPW repeat domain-containing protein n=1 Tax=Pontibacter vulgaris TaxID=2905679 RepID=UPI001FA72235|nr:SPW repeat protein [Pontibacter vulgaris]
MRFIPTRFHGVLDYIVGLLLIASPWLFDFAAGGAETWVPVIAGSLVLLQTILTDFEAGIIRMLPMQTHLMMDFAIGVLLALSPWLFGFADKVYTPHVIFGVFAILASLTTHRSPSTSYRVKHPLREHIR